jgi:methyltransferase (TIGR00027 family)
VQAHASRTARGAAAHRAIHQLIEGGAIFRDPYAVAILGEDPAELEREAREEPQRAPLRYLVVSRSRLAEDRLAAAVARGLRQAVVLGAGLDTLALRNPHRDAGLKVYEVDHPLTQAWKRERLAAAGLADAELHFTPVDFERQDFMAELGKSGFDREAPAFFLWLGVVPYLSRAAIEATLAAMARGPAEVVFDYGEPPEAFDAARRAWLETFLAHLAALGEPLLSHFHPAAAAALLRQAGFAEVEDFGPHEMARYLGGATPPPPGTAGAHVIHARSGGRPAG